MAKRGGAKGLGEVLIQIAATTAGLQSEFNKSRKVLKTFSKDLEDFKRTIEATLLLKAATAATRKVMELGEAFGQLAKRGEEVGDIEDHFKRLGGSSSAITQAKAAIGGTVSSLELMKAEAAGLIAQGPGFDKYFTDIVKFANQFADATGGDAVTAINDLTRALSTGASKELKKFGIDLSQTKDKAMVTKEGLNFVAKAAKGIVPEVDSAGKAFQAVEVAMDDARDSFAKGVNGSDDLKRAYRALADEIDKIDWETLGKEAAQAFATILGAVKELLPYIKEFFSDTLRGFNAITSSSTQAELDRTAQKIKALKDEMASGPSTKGNFWDAKVGLPPEQTTTDSMFGDQNRFRKQSQEMQQLVAHFKELQEKLKGTQEQGAKTTDVIKGGLKADADAAKKVGEEADKLKEKFKEAFADKQAGQIGDSLRKAIESGNAEAVKDLTEKYKAAIGVIADYKLAEFGDISAEEAKQFKDVMIAEGVDPMLDSWKEKQEDMFQESVDFWRSAFELAIDGTTEDLKRILKDIAIGFAGQLLASLTGGFKLGSPMDIGGSLASMLLGGGGGGGGMGGLGGMLGAAALGSSQLGGFMAAMGSASAIGPVASGAAYSGMLGATGMGLAGAMPYIGAGLIAAQFAPKIFGSLKKRFAGYNADNEARKKVEQFLEQQTGRNFDIGGHGKFDEGAGGFDFLKGLDENAQTTFTALGDGLKEVLGITEDIGPQIGAILAENLNGNLDKARVLTKQLGISQEDLEAAVIKAGLAMGKTWVQIQAELNGIAEAFKPGLSAVGDLKGAIEALAGSANTGMEKLQELRDIAVEATEVGVKDFNQLKQELLKIWNPADVEALFKALATYGITSLDQLENASDKTVIAILAMMEALGFSFKKVADEADNAADSVDNLADSAADATNTAAGPPTSGAGGQMTTPHALGGVVNRRIKFRFGGGRLGLMGEAGPEAILPLTRVNGVLGVRSVGGRGGSGNTIFMDLRGAAPGVGEEVKRALAEMQGNLDNRISEVVMDNIRRGSFDI